MSDASQDFSSSPSSSPITGFFQSVLSKVKPPEWVVEETQNRLVLFLNHVLMAEPAAQDRLRRQKGKVVLMQWGGMHLALAPTAAGLLERPSTSGKPDLSVKLTQTSPFALVQTLIAGDKPGVDIQGDVQLAAEVAWLVDNVRWDVEEDLSRIVGDAAAHTLVRTAKSAALAVKGFVERGPGGLGVQISEDPSPTSGRGTAA